MSNRNQLAEASMTLQPSSAPVALLLVLAVLADVATAATITVNSTLDTAANDGLCTLREAIASANDNVPSGGMANECAAGQAFPTIDQIHFAIPGGADAVHTITPTAALPPLTAAVVIDGYTQGNASPNTQAIGTDAKLLIEINGSALPSGAVLLSVNTDGATIRGLVINQLAFNTSGLWINGHNGNTISGNYVETDPTGNTFADSANASVPVTVVGNANHVGGTNPGDRNVLAGGHGFGSSTLTIAGTGNVVQGNYIGVSADGTSALQPGTPVYAIDPSFQGPSSGTLIGGTAPGAGNVIYGAAYAIHMRFGVDAAVIQGNYIGTDATGSHALGAGGYGIMIIGAKNTTIGGVGAGNVISGYGDAITTYNGENEPGTVIQGNLIGTDSTGTHAIPNSGSGIRIGSPGVDLGLTATQSMVGGLNPGEGNTIAYNCGPGVRFENVATFTRWPILGNSIHSNNGLGIALQAFTDLPTPNDSGDADTGPNNLQNYPVITSAPVSSGSVSISGTLNSTPSKQFRIEFFSGIGCHAKGYGEGRHFLGAMNAVTTNGSGNASFNSPPLSVPAGQSVFTATATDPDGNTSELSQCFGTPSLLFHDDFEGGCAGYD
jgi:CSLREA domain-containing protein